MYEPSRGIGAWRQGRNEIRVLVKIACTKALSGSNGGECGGVQHHIMSSYTGVAASGCRLQLICRFLPSPCDARIF
jgi:hypothetical protein